MKDRFGIDWSRVRSSQRALPQGVPFWAKPQLGRRMFFRHLATAVGGYFLMPTRPMETIAKASVTTRGTARNIIFVLMSGAPSHTDTRSEEHTSELQSRLHLVFRLLLEKK